MKRHVEENRFLTYLEFARFSKLCQTGFTHVEFMPIMEYPYDPSSYQLWAILLQLPVLGTTGIYVLN
jgi:1,4-alpha-glucan branching enzyme